jgi:hypothetical protein
VPGRCWGGGLVGGEGVLATGFAGDAPGEGAGRGPADRWVLRFMTRCVPTDGRRGGAGGVGVGGGTGAATGAVGDTVGTGAGVGATGDSTTGTTGVAGATGSGFGLGATIGGSS